MNERFESKMADPKVAHDTRVMADFVRVYCDAHHQDRARSAASTDAAATGVYGRKVPTLCEECVAHLAYAEKRRAYCSKDPKPYCAHCDTHCYRSEESEWQARMMRFSGPKSWKEGHLIDGIRHLLEGLSYRKKMARLAIAEATQNREES